VLWLAAAGDPRAAQSLDVLVRNHVRHEVLDGEVLAHRYPQIAVPTGGWGLLEPDSGALLARRAVQALVAACGEAGVDLRIDTVLPVAGDAHLEALRTASGEPVRASRYVFACGPWLGRVLPDVLGQRLFPTRQEVFYFGAAPGDTRFAAPALPVWLDSARDYYGLPDLDGRGFKLAHDAHGGPCDPDTQDRAPTPARIAHARDFLAARFPALAQAPLLGAEVCQYENTANGDLVLDRHPAIANAWIAGGGSGHGFKHGPAAGAYLAARMLDDGPVEPRFGLAGKQTVQKREVH
jgi:glycine/D-amino acid oxidase-like deaminating enzyme